jgi:hypothetical protein
MELFLGEPERRRAPFLEAPDILLRQQPSLYDLTKLEDPAISHPDTKAPVWIQGPG